MIRRNAHITEHAPKVLPPPANPYARDSSPQKRQQDGQTDGLSKTTFLDVLNKACSSQIRPYREFDFLLDANTSIGHGGNMGLGSNILATR